ncbi:MAG: hypothetical protein K6G38_06240 [Gammaproteobacteria bacterium]|nr:hypothetical protein [Gammaproteobacteria bacterium]
MNKIHINQVDGYAATTKKIPNGTLKMFRDTLRFCAEDVTNEWHSPDDMFFDMFVHGILSHPINVIIKMQPMKASTKRPCGPQLTIESTYKSDVLLSEHMTADVLKILQHFGLSALYNRTKNDIVVKTEHL